MQKIAIGQGTTYKTKKGKWRIEFYYKVNDEKKRKTFTSNTKKEAQERRVKFLQEKEVKQENINVLINEWLYKHEKEVNISKGNTNSTFTRLVSTVKNNLLPFTTNLTTKNYTKDILEENVFKRLREKNENDEYIYSYSQFKKVYIAVDRFSKYLLDNKYIEENPVNKIIRLSEKANPPKVTKAFTKEEQEEFTRLAFTKNKKGEYIYRYGASHIFQMQTGLREGEMLALRWSDIDIENEYLIVRNTITLTKEDKEGTKTKSGDNRVIPLTKLAIRCLEIIKENQIKENMPNEEYILTTTKNKRLHIRYYAKSFNKMTKCLGINKTGTHILRKTFGTRLFEKDVAILTISKLLGHKDTSVTEKVYIDVINDLKEKAIREIDIPLLKMKMENFYI